MTSLSIRKKMLLFLGAIFVIVFCVIVVSGLYYRRHVIEAAENKALLLVQSLAAQQEQIDSGTRLLLSTLAQLSRVQTLDAEACNGLFHDINQRHPFYSVIAAATPDGNMFAASTSFEPGTVNLADRKHVQEVLKTLDFSVGEYIEGRVSKVPSLNFSYPVMDADKRLIAIVVAGFKLDEYARFITKAKLPEDSVVTITDHAGVRLYRLPDDDVAPVGKSLPEKALISISEALDTGTFEMDCQDGVRRLVAFKQLRLKDTSPPYLTMIVGFSLDTILHEANRAMFGNLVFMGVVAGIALTLVWVFGDCVFVRPIDQLVTAIKRVGKGESGVRTDLPHTSDELGQLAGSFDDMASLLEVRNAERLVAEEALRRSEEQYRRLFETQIDIYYRTDAEGRLALVSPSVTQATGYTREEVTGADMGGFYANRKDREKFLALVRKNGAVDNYDIPLKRKDGSLIWLSVNARLNRDEAGNYLGLEGVARDVTEHKRIEEALRQSEERYRQLVEHSPVGIAVNCEGKIVYINPAGAEILGAETQAELEGRPVLDLIHPDYQKIVKHGILYHQPGCSTPLLEQKILRIDGQVIDVEVTGMAIEYAGKQAFQMVFRDIGDRKKAQLETLKIKKLESLGTLAGGIAHDFNNLLSVILGNISLAQVDLDPTSETCKLLQEAERACERSRDLTQQYIIFSAGGIPARENTFIPKVLTDAARQALAGSNVTEEMCMDNDLWPVYCDPEQIRQAVINLLSNAKDAMQDGGVVIMQAKNMRMEKDAIPLVKAGRYVRITILDSGKGITEEHIPKIFDPYFSSKEMGMQKGMGLGLTIVHSIVKAHEGYITVDSKVGVGTTVQLYLPAVASALPAMSEEPAGGR